MRREGREGKGKRTGKVNSPNKNTGYGLAPDPPLGASAPGSCWGTPSARCPTSKKVRMIDASLAKTTRSQSQVV